MIKTVSITESTHEQLRELSFNERLPIRVIISRLVDKFYNERKESNINENKQ